MTPPPVILGWSLFRASTNGHGGNARSEQIAELVAEAGFTYQVIERTGAGHPLSDRLRGLALKSLHRRRWRNIPAFLLGFYITLLDRTLGTHPGPRVLLCEDTLLPVPLWRAHRHGFKTIALPHNVETLSGIGSDLHALGAELEAMQLADEIFCIADEDAWLWTNLGLRAQVLPYFPLGARRRRLAAIAASRPTHQGPDAPWLLLGTAHHAPTREGMRTVLRWLEPALAAGLPFVVAGHGTESLAAEAPSRAVFTGSISDEELDSLLRRARGLVVHQERGTGALTRIPEALTAGLPVLASRLAARSTGSLFGVTRYETADELLALVQSPTPPIPPPRAPAGDAFITRLRALASPC